MGIIFSEVTLYTLNKTCKMNLNLLNKICNEKWKKIIEFPQ